MGNIERKKEEAMEKARENEMAVKGATFFQDTCLFFGHSFFNWWLSMVKKCYLAYSFIIKDMIECYFSSLTTKFSSSSSSPKSKILSTTNDHMNKRLEQISFISYIRGTK